MLRFVLVPISPVIGFICLISFPISIVLFKLFVAYHILFNPFPSVEKEFESKECAPLLVETMGNHRAICTMDSIESNQLKFEMIRAAQKSIVISGCYCGGKIFNEALDLISWRLSESPDLTAEILSSTIWLEKRNFEKLKEIKAQFPNRFFYTTTREKNLFAQSVFNLAKISSNHVKAMVIDYGRFFMIGGSALQDRWTTDTGARHLPALNLSVFSTLTQESMAPRAFRDSDFLVYSPDGGIGRRVYLELMKLIGRWEQCHSNVCHVVDRVPSVYPEVSTSLPSFAQRADIVEGVDMAFYVSGPEFEERAFMYHLIDKINSAEEEIYINHLYFHPPMLLMQALINAAERGVQIKVLTNPVTMTSPGLHFLFAALSKKNLIDLTGDGKRKNVRVFEFHRDRVTLHKKIVIVDRKHVLTGSSNFGYTSMKGAADYEFDLSISSKAFAEHTLEKSAIDEKMCKQEKIELKGIMKLLVPFQACLEFLL